MNSQLLRDKHSNRPEKYFKSILDRIDSLITSLLKKNSISINGKPALDFMKKLIDAEKFWVEWKNDNCPNLDTQIDVSELEENFLKKRNKLAEASVERKKKIKTWLSLPSKGIIDFLEKKRFKNVW